MGTYSDLVQTPSSPTLKDEKKQSVEKRTSERSVDATKQANKEPTTERLTEPPNLSNERTNETTNEDPAHFRHFCRPTPVPPSIPTGMHPGWRG